MQFCFFVATSAKLKKKGGRETDVSKAVCGRIAQGARVAVAKAAEELDIRPYRDGDDDRREMQARGFDLAWVPPS